MARTKQAAKKVAKGLGAEEKVAKRVRIAKGKSMAAAIADKVKRPHRWRAGTVALREIRRYQKGGELLVPKKRIERLVREVANECASKHVDLRFQAKAIEAAHEACEAFLVNLFENTNLLTLHRSRQTITPKDLHLAVHQTCGLSLYQDWLASKKPVPRAAAEKAERAERAERPLETPKPRAAAAPKPKKVLGKRKAEPATPAVAEEKKTEEDEDVAMTQPLPSSSSSSSADVADAVVDDTPPTQDPSADDLVEPSPVPAATAAPVPAPVAKVKAKAAPATPAKAKVPKATAMKTQEKDKKAPLKRPAAAATAAATPAPTPAPARKSIAPVVDSLGWEDANSQAVDAAVAGAAEQIAAMDE